MTFPSVLLYPSMTTFPSSVPVGSEGLGIDLGDLNLTGFDTFGCQYRTFSPLVGWDGSPASSVTVTQKPRGPGGWTSPRNLTSRVITLNGWVGAPDDTSLQLALERLNAAATLSDTILTMQRGSTVRSAIVCRQGEVLITDDTDVGAYWSIQLLARDPRKFTTAVSGSTVLPFSTGGLTIPRTIPFTIVSGGSNGTVSLTNPGNATGAVTVRVDGPANGPVITHLGTGLQLTFASSLVLVAGEWLEIDMEQQTALGNGQSSRNAFIVDRGWSGFDPGANLWRVDSASYDPATTFTVTATPAWQ